MKKLFVVGCLLLSNMGFAAGPRVSILGDSYSSWDGVAVYPGGYNVDGYNGVTSIEQTYWMKFIRHIGGTLEVNNAYEGSCVSDAGLHRQFVTKERLDNIGDPDILLICGGMNDSWLYNVPLGDYVYSGWTDEDLTKFRPSLAYVIDYVKARHPNTEIILLANSNDDWISGGAYGGAPGLDPAVCASISEIAQHYGLMFVQFHDIAKAAWHPTVGGFATMADQLNAAYDAAHPDGPPPSKGPDTSSWTLGFSTKAVTSPRPGVYVVNGVGNVTITSLCDQHLSSLMLVGGGGGGGATIGGGGGGGEVRLLSPAMVLESGSAITATIGAGGIGGTGGNTSGPGANGGTTRVAFGTSEIVAVGGGGGGGWTTGQSGGDGANGGGGCYTSAGGSPTVSSGHRGGNALPATNSPGGGGGAGGDGQQGLTGVAGAGGQGFVSAITGETCDYGAGGGGGCGVVISGKLNQPTSSGAAGGQHAGAGGASGVAGESAVSGFGGGGGGGGFSCDQNLKNLKFKKGGDGGSGCLIIVVSPIVSEFPYVSGMIVRHETNATRFASFESPVSVPAVNGGMPMTDSVATLYAAVVDFSASDAGAWTVGTNAVGVVQAALTMKQTEDACVWMGYSDGKWKEFSSEEAPAEEGEWEVKVDVDYTVQPAKIRYSVRKSGDVRYVALSNEGTSWVPTGTTGGEQKVNQVLLYGCGETGLVQAKSGAREASVGSVTAANALSLASTNLVVTVNATDAWGVDKAVVDINGHSVTNDIVGGQSLVDVSRYIAMGEDYTYDVSLVGSYRGKDMSVAGGSKEVFIGNTDTWFAYENGTFTNATADANLTNDGGVLSAAAVSPRGCVNPIEAVPGDPVALDLVSTIAVAGAVRESALTGLDASSAKAALTVVRFTDGSRGWAVRTADGWKRLTGEGISAVNGTYTVRMSFDYRHGETNVTYAIKDAADVFVTLEDADHETSFAAGDALVAKASLLGGTVSSLVATCKSVPKTDVPPAVDPSKGEMEVQVKAANEAAAGTNALAAIVVPAAAGLTSDAQAAYRKCFKVVSATPVAGMAGSYDVVLALDEKEIQADAVTADVAADLDNIAVAFAAGETGTESGPIEISAAKLKPGLWYSIASSAAVGFAADAEGDRVQATGSAIQLKAKKPEDVENACFFRVLVNAADKKF